MHLTHEQRGYAIHAIALRATDADLGYLVWKLASSADTAIICEIAAIYCEDVVASAQPNADSPDDKKREQAISLIDSYGQCARQLRAQAARVAKASAK